MDSLRSRLTYQPSELRFGTSGRRGEVAHLSQLEIYINALAELKYLQTLEAARGGITRGERFYYAYDLRPSSTQFVADQGGRGEIAQTIHRAIRDAGMQPVNLGLLPTPALACYALREHKGSIMVTGSHIPFDRNGYKLNTSRGELLKEHEGPINEAVKRERERLYAQPYDSSDFDERGFFKSGHAELPPVGADAGRSYLERYLQFFGAKSLQGMRLLVYQHSAAGRDLLLELLQKMGADATPAGRSEQFVPIDTENIGSEQLALIQSLVGEHGPVDAVVATDGDSDRPLILGLDESGKVRFFGGDLVGMVVAAYLKADAVVVPISCNDSIDRGPLADALQAKTRIGSPFVIAGMQKAHQQGKRVVCGWEANGGFLLGSDVERDGKVLPALPTRDAFLPIVCTLLSAKEKNVSLCELFGGICSRHSRAGLLKNFPRPIATRIIERLTPALGSMYEFDFGKHSELDAAAELLAIRDQLCQFFKPEHGFGPVAKLNYTDGVRITFESGEIAHLRPSGNADELRIYAAADSAERADEIVARAIAEPDGILRRLERACN